MDTRRRQTCSHIALGLLIAAVVAGCTAAGALSGPSDPAARVTFAVVGDYGYEPGEEPAVERLLADLNRVSALAFVVHVGDLSSPRYACAREVRERRLAQFRASVHPLVFTPG